jgi:predicted GNAT family N-acyltransferase
MEVRVARDESEIEAAKDLRIRVFSGEQGIAPGVEIDGLDPASTHVIALRRGNVVGTCRLRYPGGRGKLERMAVDPALRRAGVGSLLVAEAEAEVRRQGAEAMYLHAQRRFEAFYTSCGYASEGETFLEEGIPHVLMRKQLGAA